MLLTSINSRINKRKWIYALVIVLCIALGFIFKAYIFKSTPSKNEISINGIPELKGNERTIITMISRLHQENKKEQAYSLLNEMNEKAQDEENKLALYYVNSLKCYIFSSEKQYEQSVNHGKIALDIATKYFDTINITNTYQNICASYSQIAQSDSVEKYTSLGFEHALIKGDSIMLKTFAMNLGTLAFNKNLPGLAGYYFVKASAIKANGFANTDTLLYANLVSILISNKDYEEAEKIWQLRNLDAALDGDEYDNQNLQCNRIALFQAQKKWDKSRALLSKLNLESFNPDFKAALFTNTWNQIYNDKGIEACADYISKHKAFFEEYFIQVVSSLITLLPHDQIYRIGSLNSTFVQSLIDKYAIEQSNDRLLKYSAHMLLGIILQYEDKHEQANKNYLIAHKNHNEYLEINDSLRVRDIDHEIKFERLLSEQYELNRILTTKTKENQMLILLGSISILFLVTLIILFYLNGQRKQVEFQLLSIEKQQIEEKDKHLEKEKQLNNRIVELSKSIIIKSNELGSTITSTTTNSAKELYNIKRELAKISYFENIEHPEIADKLYQNNELYEKLFPSLKDFNKTEKRIFALSAEDYKVKDISILMGLSSQYVHNVRSRLKKKVGLNEEITWSEFKKRALAQSDQITS
jgi:hypothetical protein